MTLQILPFINGQKNNNLTKLFNIIVFQKTKRFKFMHRHEFHDLKHEKHDYT